MRKNNKGFTLIEMLIVVAIIAILVAVSIPLVNNSLERTREATDAANERAAKAEAIIKYLNDDWVEPYNNGENHYDAKTGSFISGTPDAGEGYGKCTLHKGDYISAAINDGVVSITWSSNNTPHNGDVADNGD